MARFDVAAVSIVIGCVLLRTFWGFLPFRSGFLPAPGGWRPGGLLLLWLMLPAAGWAGSKLYMQDTLSDTGVEPNPDNGTLSASPDIWVRSDPIAGYQPAPYATASPPLWLSALGANPDQAPWYHDPLQSHPNYVYVRVHNIGDSASSGTEQLHVYWAKASTGLSWPAQWVDYMSSTCGPSTLFGMEITKPRRNFADPTVPQAEIDNYVNAINNIASLATYQFPDGIQYWYKQNQEHYFVVDLYGDDPTFSAHFMDSFLPWHREFINRYEMLLRKASPTVTLFYWDWTTDPRNAPQSTVFASMGNYNDGITGSSGPFYNPLQPPEYPGWLDSAYPKVSRFTGGNYNNPAPESAADSDILAPTTFSQFAVNDEGRGTGKAHNYSHVFIGGRSPNGGSQEVNSGNMSLLEYAAQDPFFFMLHADVDRLWSVWQRQLPADQTRFDPATAYTGTSADMTKPMAPWNGYEYNGASGTKPPTPLRPFVATDGQIAYKAANDPSVVFPPIYDTAPLTIPVLQPNQSVVIEIPWYPPNPEDFACFNGDQRHVCLLARIETSPSYPYGMTSPEGTIGDDLYTNVQNNARIAWKNITVLPASWGMLILAPALLHNLSSGSQNSQMHMGLSGANGGLTNFGQIILDLGPDLFARWQANGASAPGFQPIAGSTSLLLTGTSGDVLNLPLNPGEMNQVQVELVLRAGYPDPQGQVFNVDLTQSNAGLPGVPPQVVGGQRFAFDFNRLRFVPPGSSWRYVSGSQLPDPNWNQAGYDDSHWLSGAGKLGFGIGNETTVVDQGPTNSPYITTWFRFDFPLRDLNVYSNLWLELKAYDGAVVYLNGTEIQRVNMPGGAVTPTTFALGPRSGVATDTFFPFDVSGFLPLLAPSNVVAVEVHRSSANAPYLGFDLQLDANLFAPNFSPQAAFLSPARGALFLQGQPISLTAEAIGLSGPVTSVAYYDGLQLIGSSRTAPYSVTWNNAPLGTRQLTVVAADAAGRSGYGFTSVQVMTNVPPTVTVTSPAQDQVFPTNATIVLSADARKNGGTVQQVEFFIMQRGPGFMNPVVSLGTITSAPFQMQLNVPTNGIYLLSAVATDNAGVRTFSNPRTIYVASIPPPSLSISNAPPFMILNWTPTNAVLQQATSLTGPWQTIPTATPPYGFIPDPAVPMNFYRVFLSSAQIQLNREVICGPPPK